MLVVIDGDCSFCQWAARLLRKICLDVFDFTTLNAVSPEIRHTWESDPAWAIDSIKVIDRGQLYIKSSAVRHLLRFAKWYAQPLRLLFLLPKSTLDRMYDWVARHRRMGQSCDLE